MGNDTLDSMKAGQQRVVLITGASSGIGRACASYLSEMGFRVYGTSRRAAVEAGETGFGSVQMLAMDITCDESVERGIGLILEREGRIDIVINNAGMGIAGPVETTSIEEAQRQFEVNFFGAFRVCRAVLPPMRQQGEGYVINIGSIGGVIALPYQAMYSASKFALEGLSEALRLEVGAMGIRVTMIQPGDHKTAFTESRQIARASGEDGVYAGQFHAALARIIQDEQAGPGPERIARLVHRIVNLRDPRLRYTIGPPAQRAAVWLKRLLPYSLMERGMRRHYRLGS
jgi:NAD(P)-dependent dehydrogenase (short-subunit alcohol dehydrogenase family)